MIRLGSELSLLARMRRWAQQQQGDHLKADPPIDYAYSLQNNYVELSAEELGDKGRELQRYTQRLWPHLRLRFYLIPESKYQAFTCTNPLDHQAIFGVSTSMLRDFSAHELSFVFGHELGHQVYQHAREHISLERSLKSSCHEHHLMKSLMQSLKRRAEISCDRLGLLCCADLEVALRSLCKVAADAPMGDSEVEASIYRSLSRKPAYHFIDPEIDHVTPWDDTHPPLSIRVQALQTFGEADLHREISSSPDPQIQQSLAQVNRRVDLILDSLEHDHLKRDQQLVRRYHRAIFTLSQLLVVPSHHWTSQRESSWRAASELIKRLSSRGRRVRIIRALSLRVEPWIEVGQASRRLQSLQAMWFQT